MRSVGDNQRALRRAVWRVVPVVALAPLLACGLLLAQLALPAPGARADGAHVDSLTFKTDVSPGSAQFVTDAISAAEGDGATLLLINLDTPGGDLDSMKAIVQAELASTIPIVVYVSPQGGRAASAGTFIALAAPIVAMAPNTRIGAASPVDSSGNNLPATEDRKVKNDLEAQISGIQTTFQRNVPLAVAAVENAASYDDQDAINNHLVNMGAENQAALLSQLDGMSVPLANGSTVTLHTAGLPAIELQETLGDQVKSILFDPNVLFILFVVALVCIYLELSHPGAIVPGTVGAIALVIFLFGAGALNPNWSGLVLMLLAIVLLAVDLRTPTHGVLTVGALICLVVGSLIFFNSGADRGVPTVSPVLVGAFAAAVGLVSATLIQYVVRISRRRVATGSAGLIGEKAVAITALAPRGRVKVLGENWAARLPDRAAVTGLRLEAQTPVRVVGIDGLTLIVEPALGPLPPSPGHPAPVQMPGSAPEPQPLPTSTPRPAKPSQPLQPPLR
jgi:membrane-bound serine protease (ClpP class)